MSMYELSLSAIYTEIILNFSFFYAIKYSINYGNCEKVFEDIFLN